MAVSAVVDDNEIQGPTATVVNTTYTWGPQEFAGFYYDIDDNLGEESITMIITGDTLAEDTTPRGVVYRTTAQKDEFDFDAWGEYYTIGFLAEEYFAGYVEADTVPKEASYLYVDSTDENLMVDEQLSKILTDDDDEYTFTTGTPLKLAEGYELSIKAIDLDGNKVYVELYKDGKSVDSAVIEPSKDNPTMEDKTYAYTKDMGDTEDIVVIAVHFKNAFRGAEQD
ncbi:MAG: S-layer protein, partial [Methanothrix sp.]